MRSALLFTFGLLYAAGLPAQQSTLTGPVEAYTFDAPTRSLRPVFGFPGAATFGPALHTSLEFASVAPLQSYAIGFQNGQCLLIAGLGSTVSTLKLAGVEARPDGIAWSGNGSLAVLYSLSGNWLQSISGLPSAPVVGKRVEGSSLGGVLASVAADAKGKLIAAGVTGEAAGVYQSSDGEAFSNLKPVARPLALSFSSATGSSDSTTLYVLDGSVPQAIAINLSSRGDQSIPLDGFANPIAIQAVENSQNVQQLYVAAARELRILDVATQQTVSDVPLSFQATGLCPFGSGSYVVAARVEATSPLWLFTATPQPGAYFVPAIHSPSPAHGHAGLVEDGR
jgi:hypothetical protein